MVKLWVGNTYSVICQGPNQYKVKDGIISVKDEDAPILLQSVAKSMDQAIRDADIPVAQLTGK